MDVTLYLGRENDWPYKLRSSKAGRRRPCSIHRRRRALDGRPIGALSSIERIPPTVITLIYSDVKLNGPIPVDQFAFQCAANATVDDSTESLLKGPRSQ